MQKSSSGGKEQMKFNHDINRYPAVGKAIKAILADLDDGTLVVERIEVNCLRNGEVTYRYWEPEALESDGGVLTP